MPRIRALVCTCVMFLLVAVVAWGCSSADDDGQAAAAQPAAADLTLSDVSLAVSSPSFQEKVRPRTRIPKENTCYGENVSPPLDWNGAPDGTKAFALLVENPDHHTGNWVHWVLYNIPPDVARLSEGISTSTYVLPNGTTQGTNDDRQPGYTGPCPDPQVKRYDAWGYSAKPKQSTHRWYFRVYALDAELGLAPGATKAELVSAMEGHVLAQGDTMGKFSTSIKVEIVQPN